MEIISEASRHIPKDIQAQHSEVPWRKVRGIGDILRHDYGNVDDFVIWNIAVDSLPTLRDVVERILKDLPDDGSDSTFGDRSRQ